MNNQSTKFSKNGLLTGTLLIVTEYILFSLFYSRAEPDLWEDRIPHKYIFYIIFVSAAIILVVVLTRQGLKDEIIDNSRNLFDFKENVGRMLGFAVFGSGTYIIYNVLKARIFNDVIIPQFVDNNLYVSSAAQPFAIINQIFYPIVLSFVYQGFLLNGLSKHISYEKSTIVTSLFYGYWSQDLIGATAINLFLNHVFNESKNILYPIILSILINLLFLVGYIINQEIWFLKAHTSDYNDELMKGFILTIIGLPVVVPALAKIFKQREKVLNG